MFCLYDLPLFLSCLDHTDRIYNIDHHLPPTSPSLRLDKRSHISNERCIKFQDQLWLKTASMSPSPWKKTVMWLNNVTHIFVLSSLFDNSHVCLLFTSSFLRPLKKSCMTESHSWGMSVTSRGSICSVQIVSLSPCRPADLYPDSVSTRHGNKQQCHPRSYLSHVPC